MQILRYDPWRPDRLESIISTRYHPPTFRVKISNSPRSLDVVWPKAKQIGLIGSIFQNFYIPPIVFAVQRDDEGEEVHICVDGKQVCSSNNFYALSIDLPDIYLIAPNINTEILWRSSMCIIFMKMLLLMTTFQIPHMWHFQCQLTFISPIILWIDRDIKTKKNFWYTTSESWRGIRNEVPERFKRDFAEKQIICGWSYCLWRV